MKCNLPDDRHNYCGKALRTLRKQQGLSQEALAAQFQLAGLNINQKAISRIERGKRIVPDFELLFFASFFDVPIKYLFENHDK